MEISPLSRISTAVPVDPVALSTAERMQAAIRELNKSEMFGADRQLEYARDDEMQKMVIRIVRRKTGEVLEQIPPEEVLRILKELRRLEKPETSG